MSEKQVADEVIQVITRGQRALFCTDANLLHQQDLVKLYTNFIRPGVEYAVAPEYLQKDWKFSTHRSGNFSWPPLETGPTTL